jgi:hypothetical protein
MIPVKDIEGRYMMGQYHDRKIHIRIKRDRQWRWLIVDHALLDTLESQVTVKSDG